MARVNKTTFYRWQKASDKPTLVPLPKLLPMVRFSQEDVEAYLNALGGATGGVIIPSNENNQNLQGAA
jgi:hypothetical protein